ncbi:dystrophin-like [Cydia fagiglandana]|uniref:dystrophin-like n=1 Tax=Cydia fagiglandana TaxID=1458189 RepID=UPI002FEE0B6C
MTHRSGLPGGARGVSPPRITWVVRLGDPPALGNAPYETHLTHSKYEREDVQKKTFAKWINSQLVKNGKPLVGDLFADLRDGEVLLSLLEILTAQQYKRERGRMRVHHVNNVSTALRALNDAGVRLVNIAAADVVDGNPKLILGLVWSIILHWQVQYHLKELMSELHHTSLERTLLAWCRAHTQGYEDVDVTNFTSSWADGLALNALLHRWRPQLFDFHEVAQRAPSERLDHAFTLAHNYLGIDRLLDPEDVNTPNPDKKSIMMYLMCLFQSLPHSTPELATMEPDAENVGPDSEPASPLGNTAESGSRPLSTATTGSGELGGYSAALEEALAWLLDAEERLAARAAPAAGAALAELKEHFHVHEAFLLELAAQQARVGGALALGARLAADGALSGAEAREVRLQLRLLAERWEQLRARGMARQAQVHEALMKAQQETRHEFRQWLTATEDRISKLGPLPGDTPEEASASLAAITALHEALREQQPRVDALADCVLVLDDNEDTAGVVEMEDELRALGERWSHTCQWTLAQLARLQALQDLQPTGAEEQLKQMEANPVSTVQEVLERISTLQQIKHSVSLQQARAIQHTERASALIANGEAAGVDFSDVFARAEELQDRAEALLMILDVQAQRIREQGFEVELVTTQQSPMDAENTVTTTTVTVTSSSDARRSKKPRLSGGADFQAGYKPYENWAKTATETLEKCARDLEDSSVPRATVSATLERLDKELSVQRQDFANVEEIQRRLATDPALKEEAEQHAKIIEELKQRWDDIQRGATSLRNTMNLLEDKDSFHRAAASLREALQDAQAWRDRMLRDKPSNNQLIHLRNKLRALRQLEIKRKELDAQSIILLTKPIAPAYKEEIESTAKELGTEYEELLNYLSAKEVEIKLAINKKPQETVKDEFENLQRKIQDIESRVIVEHVMFSTAESMENKVKELKSLRSELEELQAGYDEVVKARRQQYEAGSVQELNVRSSLENLVTKFGDTQVLLEQKIDKLENGVKLVEQLEADTTELKQWLDKLDKFLADNEFIPIGDVQLLESLLDTSNKYDEEKEKYETMLTSIDNTRATILEDCDESLGRTLRSDGSPAKRFLDTTKRARTLNEGLRRALERTESVFRQIADTESWLKELEAQIPKEEDCRISDSAELYKVKMVFQTLKDKCDDKTQEFRNLNEAGNDMMLAAEERRPAALARRLTALSARWTDVTRGVYERYKVLAEAWHETGELRAWLAQEAAWLDGLERRLRSRHQPADAEELSAQLYDLESYMRNHSSLRLSRIQDVGRQLADAHIMAGWIRAEIHALQDRWNTLQAEAASRTATLEGAAREAAQSEVAVDRLQQWLRRAQAGLAGAGGGGGDHQDLVEQIETQRESLKEIETQVEAYRSAGRPEAAERLQHQLDLLRRQLEECVERLSTLGTPEPSGSDSSLEARLSRATRTLRGVQAGAERELALSSAQPDAVRAVLRRCLKFYRTLSEIKSEVESVIKTGRKMAEEEDGRELSPRIDALKELYNRLGAQVTESKTRLENALLTAREIHNDLGALGAWLDGLGAGVGRQTLELEMSRMEAIKDKLNANHREYAKSCDPASLAELREQVDEINARWERLKKHGVTKDDSSPQKFLEDVARELASPATLTDAKLRALEGELRARANDIRATNDPALVKQLDKLIADVASAARSPAELPLCTSTPLKEMQMDVQPKRERDSKSPSPRRSHIPLSRERLRLHTERMQGSEPESPPLSPVSAGSRGSPPLSPLSPPGAAPDSLLGALGAAPDEELAEYEAAATAAARRMDVMMVTVGAVDAEKDPGKRLEILKNQLGALAPEAAALISRGDSLVYARHATSPLLAEYVRTHSDRLRNKWAQVMAEIEAKRNVAIRAEDNIKELNTLLESLQRWLKRLEGDIKAERGLVKEEFLDREGDVERVSELCRALRAARVGYPERAVADLGQAWTRARQLYEATHKPKRDKKGKIDASEALCGEYVTRANRCRERVAAVARLLQAPPLGTRDYDEFPLQEDALAKVKSSISELEAVVAETESVFTSLSQQPSDNAQATRVRRKLQTEWTALQDNYKERRERWTRCQAEWAALYAALEACGAWLDNAERSLQQARNSQEPLKDLKQKLRDLEQQMSARAGCVSAARAGGRAVLGACGGALARGVQDQLEQLLARWLKAAADLQALQHKVSSLEASRDSPRDAETALAGVRALLDTTSANPSDRTSLSVRLSLVKARSEELGARLQDAGPAQAQVQQACAALGAHREFLSQKLAALGKFAARLDAAAARAQAARARLAAAPQDAAAVAEVQELIVSQEAEVREVLENYNNLERECGAARQAVAPALRDRAARLRQDWAALRGHDPPTVVSETPRRGSDPPSERKGSADSQASDWSGRASGRRRSAQSQAPAVLLAHFDTTVSQIREWVSCETEMLRAQAVAVGDVDDILSQLDKQKGVLRELEQKKPQLDELLHTAESLKGTENRQQLHGKVTALREHWDEANARVLQRKAQLDAMLGDSQRYEARRRDADAWLTRMEARLAAMAQPGHTADVLEMQLREQKVRQW